MAGSILLHANNPSIWTGPTGNNTYLLPGRVPTLVDAGVGDSNHLDAIARALAGSPLATVCLTHDHPDHAGGLPAVQGRWPDVRVIRHPLAEDSRIDAGDTVLRPIPTPGHSPDHLCFMDVESEEIYSGDLMRIGGTVMIPASRGGSLRDYLDSLRRVRALGPRRALPGHGPIVEDPIALVDEYLAHRADREGQVIRALEAGFTEPRAIAHHIYGPLGALESAAADSVLAHLIKLEEEGRASRTDAVWRLV